MLENPENNQTKLCYIGGDSIESDHYGNLLFLMTWRQGLLALDTERKILYSAPGHDRNHNFLCYSRAENADPGITAVNLNDLSAIPFLADGTELAPDIELAPSLGSYIRIRNGRQFLSANDDGSVRWRDSADVWETFLLVPGGSAIQNISQKSFFIRNDLRQIALFWLDVCHLHDFSLPGLYLFGTAHLGFLGVDPSTAAIEHIVELGAGRNLLCAMEVGATDDPRLVPLPNIFCRTENGELDPNPLTLRQAQVGPKQEFTFSNEAGFVSANPTDTFQFRKEAQPWELFRLIRMDIWASALKWTGRWLDVHTREIIDLRNIDKLLPAVAVHIETRESNTVGVDFAISSLESLGGCKYIPFKPLIYFCIYGNSAYLSALAITLEALDFRGKFDGTIGIVTDFQEMDLLPYIPERYKKSLILFDIPEGSKWAGRYSIDFDKITDFQPVVYLDADVIVANAIEDFLVDVALSATISIATENFGSPPRPPHEWGDDGNYFGKFLFGEVDYNENAVKGNSGIIALPNSQTGRKIFYSTTALIAKYPDKLKWTDQPFLNFVLHTTGPFNSELVNRHAHLIRAGCWTTENKPHTLIHILNAFLRSEDKTHYLRRATRTLDALQIATVLVKDR